MIVNNPNLFAIQSFATTVEAKDMYTSGHSMRVADYALMLCKKANKDRDFTQTLYVTAMLHDIGKVGVSDSIINKTSKLTEEEFEVMKQHTIIGYNILDNINEIEDIAIGARWHHERWDGTGYPDGLKGTDIPEIARIISVADAYDAMSSNRSYRRMLPQDIVRREIESGIGTQFDPYYAKLMLEIIDEDTEYKLHG